MITKCTNTHYIYDQTDTRLYADGFKGVLEEAVAKQHSFTGGPKRAESWRGGVK